MTRPGSAAAPPPSVQPGLPEPHAIGSEGHPSVRVVGQYGFRRGAEATAAACVDLLLKEDLP